MLKEVKDIGQSYIFDFYLVYIYIHHMGSQNSLVLLVMSFFFLLNTVKAQRTFDITIISDASKEEAHFFEESLKSEITALLYPQYALNFTEVYTNGDINSISNEIAKTYAQKQADVLVGVGVLTSQILANQSNYLIPSIASIQLLPKSNAVEIPVSGISNFTYIRSPFNIKEGINVLKEICGCNHLAVLTDYDLSAIGIKESDIYSDDSTRIAWLKMEADLTNTVSMIPNEVGGVYVLSPLSKYPSSEINQFFGQLTERKLPTFTLLDAPMLELGAYASFVAGDNLKRIPRRIALNIQKIAEGENLKDFPVNVADFTTQLIVNMETVNKIGKYPSWKLLDNALLTNINRVNTSRVINLQSVIAESLQNNLGYQIASKETELIKKDVSLAKSNYLPQLNVETTGFFLDENTVNSSFGTRGDFNWTASASLSQLILSEPALANIAIQKLLYESQQQVQKQSELDVILEIAQRYFNYRQVLSVAELQNNNIEAINQNLTIATDKEQVGYSGATDVYRWKTELDIAKTDLNVTNAQLKAVGFQLNETLNRPIGEVFAIEESENISQIIEDLNEYLLELIQDQAGLDRFANFMVNEAFQNLPEIQQIELAIAAQERLLKSNQRSFYLPTVAFGANYDYPIKIVNPGVPPPIPGFEAGINPTWNAAFNLSIPLFAGNSRKYQMDKTRVGLYQLQDQRKDIRNLLELQVRANLEQVNAAYNNIRLTKSAAEAAEKNIDIVRDLYQLGQVNVTTLVDAQNALLGSQINATNATYQFMIDFFALQRSIGSYTLLETDEQRVQFLQRFINFKNN